MYTQVARDPGVARNPGPLSGTVDSEVSRELFWKYFKKYFSKNQTKKWLQWESPTATEPRKPGPVSWFSTLLHSDHLQKNRFCNWNSLTNFSASEMVSFRLSPVWVCFVVQDWQKQVQSFQNMSRIDGRRAFGEQSMNGSDNSGSGGGLGFASGLQGLVWHCIGDL